VTLNGFLTLRGTLRLPSFIELPFYCGISRNLNEAAAMDVGCHLISA
jgi:hypothetical protein